MASLFFSDSGQCGVSARQAIMPKEPNRDTNPPWKQGEGAFESTIHVTTTFSSQCTLGTQWREQVPVETYLQDPGNDVDVGTGRSHKHAHGEGGVHTLQVLLGGVGTREGRRR